MGASNKKTYIIIGKASKSFSLRISDFVLTTTLLFRIIQKVRMTFVGSIISAFTNLLRIKRVRLIISTPKLTSKNLQTINIKRVKLLASMKQSLKMLFNHTMKVRFTLSPKLIQKVYSAFKSKTQLSFTAILGTFYTLGTFDPETLLTVDANTLGDMDYTIL